MSCNLIFYTEPSFTAGSGEANTVSTLGGGHSLFASKVGVDLQFKSISAGDGIVISSDATGILIESNSGLPTGYNLWTLAHDGTNWTAVPSLRADMYTVGIGANPENGSNLYILQSNGKRGLNVMANIAQVAHPTAHITGGNVGAMSVTTEGGYGIKISAQNTIQPLLHLQHLYTTEDIFKVYLNKETHIEYLKNIEPHPANYRAVYVDNTTGRIYANDVSSGGETNTASNLGIGEGVFGAKVGADLQFKSLVAGTNVSLSSDSNEITIDVIGGGLEYFTEEKENIGGVEHVVLKVDIPEVDGSVILQPKGVGGFHLQKADGTATGGGTRGNRAVDLQTKRDLSDEIASGQESVITGGYRNTAQGTLSVVSGGRHNRSNALYATIGGGNSNLVTGDGSVIAGGEFNTASGIYSSVLGGIANTSSALYSAILGGNNNTVSGQRSTILNGSSNTISNQRSVILGGITNNITSQYSVILGGNSNSATADYTIAKGRYASAYNIGFETLAYERFAGVTGSAQYSQYVSTKETTDDSNQTLTPISSGYIPVGKTWRFRIELVGKDVGNADNFGATYVGLAKNVGGVISIHGLAELNKIQVGSAGSWTATVGTTVGLGIRIEVTGEAGKTIRWVASVHITEVL